MHQKSTEKKIYILGSGIW